MPRHKLIIKPYNRAQLMADNPMIIGTVRGIDFYEHPKFGDEVPLIADFNGKCGLTNFRDLPTLEELAEIEKNLKA